MALLPDEGDVEKEHHYSMTIFFILLVLGEVNFLYLLFVCLYLLVESVSCKFLMPIFICIKCITLSKFVICFLFVSRVFQVTQRCLVMETRLDRVLRLIVNAFKQRSSNCALDLKVLKSLALIKLHWQWVPEWRNFKIEGLCCNDNAAHSTERISFSRDHR